MTTTEQFLRYLEEKRRGMRDEKWFWTYAAWRGLRGYAPLPNWKK